MHWLPRMADENRRMKAAIAELCAARAKRADAKRGRNDAFAEFAQDGGCTRQGSRNRAWEYGEECYRINPRNMEVGDHVCEECSVIIAAQVEYLAAARRSGDALRRVLRMGSHLAGEE